MCQRATTRGCWKCERKSPAANAVPEVSWLGHPQLLFRFTAPVERWKCANCLRKGIFGKRFPSEYSNEGQEAVSSSAPHARAHALHRPPVAARPSRPTAPQPVPPRRRVLPDAPRPPCPRSARVENGKHVRQLLGHRRDPDRGVGELPARPYPPARSGVGPLPVLMRTHRPLCSEFPCT